MKNYILVLILASSLFQGGLFFAPLCAGYADSPHKPLPEGALAVNGPGSYDRAGATYVLTQDISSPASAIFLGKDVTLDLNGYTLSYAEGGYEHLPNYGFEEGLEGWDTSKAPGAKVEDTDSVHVFIGRKILRLAAGDELVSGYINLPVAERSYFAMCGVASWDMRVSLFVEDEKGVAVTCRQDYGDSSRVSSPVLDRKVRLGGGFVTAHIHGLPAGKYRVRVRAETDCLVDEIDLRPALDVGLGIVDKTYPWAHTDNLYAGDYCAFFDYTVKGTTGEPVPSIPRVSGPGTVTIKNGIIRSGTRGILSWGIQSTAGEVKVILENVKVISSGINTNAVDIPYGTLTGCRFEIETPFIINRHVSEHAVVLRGLEPSEVKDCEFYGGQGCLAYYGLYSLIHDNLFVNRQTVTNHYCVMARGDSSKVYNNRFEPEIGSGLEIFRHKFIDIYDNTFRIEASPPTCEYGHEEYSVAAVRIADYNAPPGSPGGCAGNRVYHNKFLIIGRNYPQPADYVPMAWAFFYSTSGGDNYIYDNEIAVEQKDLGSKAEAAAFYIGGGSIGGVFNNNTITTNVPAAWVGCRYGGAEGTRLEHNTISKAPDAGPDFKPIRLGWAERADCVARNIEFRSNDIRGAGFDVAATDQDHSYAVYWRLTVKVSGRSGRPVQGAEVRVTDCRGREAGLGRTDDKGIFSGEFLQYRVDGKLKTTFAPYTVKVGRRKKEVLLDKNTELEFVKK